jgi:hypothetical protein
MHRDSRDTMHWNTIEQKETLLKPNTGALYRSNVEGQLPPEAPPDSWMTDPKSGLQQAVASNSAPANMQIGERHQPLVIAGVL